MPHQKLKPAETSAQGIWTKVREKVPKGYIAFAAQLPSSYKQGSFFEKGEHSGSTLKVIYAAFAKQSKGILRFSRLTAHIERLTEAARTPQENKFGLDLARFLPGEFGGWKKLLETHDIANAILSGETRATIPWWTVSPYLHAELSKKISPKESIKLLLDWANSAKEEKNYLYLPGLPKHFDPHSPILEHRKAEYNPSHQFAQQYAKEYADLFIKTFKK